MPFPRVYLPAQYIDAQYAMTLSFEASHHLAHVLRVKEKDRLHLFDGLGNRFLAQVVLVGKKLISVEMIEKLPSHNESHFELTLLVAVGKGDKMDWIMQKATELGVKNIQPITTTRCMVQLSEERFQKKQHHWQTIVINACEQSGRDFVPMVQPVCSFRQALQTTQNALNLLLHPEGGQKLKTLLAEAPVHNARVLIGPEGGFTREEIDLAQTHGFKLASLGPRILRMETAAISSITLLQALLGDI